MTGDASGTGIDGAVQHSAPIWNYWLGSKLRRRSLAGEQTIAVLPEIVDIARRSRGFLTRVVRYLAADAGCQFLDVGTGFRRPTTRTRSHSGSRPTRGSCTSTTTRWS